MTRSKAIVLWNGVALALVALAVPWFMWGDDAVAAGLPLWIWWHVGWMVVASLAFWAFARRAWGVGIEPATRSGPESEEVTRRG